MGSTLPSPGTRERRLLDRYFNDTIKLLRDAWKGGRQADALLSMIRLAMKLEGFFQTPDTILTAINQQATLGMLPNQD